uniref:Uncharacterized protein n=1 Tax=Parastrongyloides trichosuri TaxID=131310 RepID=A0A0N5A6B6_PARTI
MDTKQLIAIHMANNNKNGYEILQMPDIETSKENLSRKSMKFDSFLWKKHLHTHKETVYESPLSTRGKCYMVLASILIIAFFIYAEVMPLTKLRG